LLGTARAYARSTFHGQRHTFGTQMAAAGAPLRAIQEWMGHADARTTEIYAHYAPNPTGGVVFAERAFGQGAIQGAIVSETEQNSVDLNRSGKPDPNRAHLPPVSVSLVQPPRRGARGVVVLPGRRL